LGKGFAIFPLEFAFKKLPKSFYGIQFRRVRRLKNRDDIIWAIESFGFMK
jgi:hypothetical protein